jgi:hypothetical protein
MKNIKGKPTTWKVGPRVCTESDLTREKGMRPIVAQVRGYLERLPATLPFPVDRYELHRKCFPESLSRIVQGPRVKGERRTAQEVNFAQTLIYVSPSEAVNFCMDTTRRHVGGAPYVFWLVFDTEVLSPADSVDHPILVPESYPQYKELQTWVGKRHALESEIVELLRDLEAAVPYLSHKVDMDAVWPELGSFVAVSPGGHVRAGARASRLRKFSTVFPASRRKRLIELLTAAVLLPDHPVEHRTEGVNYR